MEATQSTLKDAKEHAKRIYILSANRWHHRRRMAYIALFSMLALTYVCVFEMSPARIKVLQDIISWFFITMGSIVGAYMGFATLDDKWREQNKKGDE